MRSGRSRTGSARACSCRLRASSSRSGRCCRSGSPCRSRSWFVSRPRPGSRARRWRTARVWPWRSLSGSLDAAGDGSGPALRAAPDERAERERAERHGGGDQRGGAQLVPAREAARLGRGQRAGGLRAQACGLAEGFGLILRLLASAVGLLVPVPGPDVARGPHTWVTAREERRITRSLQHHAVNPVSQDSVEFLECCRERRGRRVSRPPHADVSNASRRWRACPPARLSGLCACQRGRPARITRAVDVDLLVIGSGPGGQRAAVQGAKLGKRVAVVERRDRVGGVSIHTGTIPSKTLRQAILEDLARRPYEAVDPLRPREQERQAARFLMDRTAQVVADETALIREQFRRNDIGLLSGEATFVDEHTSRSRSTRPRPAGHGGEHRDRRRHLPGAPRRGAVRRPPRDRLRRRAPASSRGGAPDDDGGGSGRDRHRVRVDVRGARHTKVTLVDARDRLLPYLDR